MCGKRQLRGERRTNFAKEVERVGSVDVFLSDQRRIYQKKGFPEPPMIPNEQTSRILKHEKKNTTIFGSGPNQGTLSFKEVFNR